MKNDEGWMKNDEGWMKNDEGWRMSEQWRVKKDEGWMMKDDDFKLLRGFGDGRTDRQTCDCRVGFTTEKRHLYHITSIII